jgi:Putative MetA-pathway of phenol degradation
MNRRRPHRPNGRWWRTSNVEYFGIFSRAKEQDTVLHDNSPELHYLLTENFEVGFRVGWGLNDQAARGFVNAGAGLRF